MTKKTKKKTKKKMTPTKKAIKKPIIHSTINLKPKVEEDRHYELRKYRLREEMKMSVYRLLIDFKSKEEPQMEVKDVDKVHVLSSIIQRIMR